jgi:hypothetical protein
VLIDRLSLVDVAKKVVGVGSVGTRCLIMLLEAGDGTPLPSRIILSPAGSWRSRHHSQESWIAPASSQLYFDVRGGIAMRQFRLLILVAAAGLLVAGHASAYDFPFENPLLATVVGTPSHYQADLPEDPPRKTLEITIHRRGTHREDCRHTPASILQGRLSRYFPAFPDTLQLRHGSVYNVSPWSRL